MLTGIVSCAFDDSVSIEVISIASVFILSEDDTFGLITFWVSVLMGEGSRGLGSRTDS